MPDLTHPYYSLLLFAPISFAVARAIPQLHSDLLAAGLFVPRLEDPHDRVCVSGALQRGGDLLLVELRFSSEDHRAGQGVQEHSQRRVQQENEVEALSRHTDRGRKEGMRGLRGGVVWSQSSTRLEALQVVRVLKHHN